jgi:hypothetical protein
MGIQINGQTDTITAIDGALTVSGAELSAVTNLNATGIVTATSFSGNLTGNLNSSGVSTVTTLRATSIVGVTTAGITTAYIGSVNDGPISGARNRIINGDMRIWQRGTSFTTTGYTADRWRCVNNGSITASRSTDAPSGFNLSLDVNGSAYPSVAQRIESANVYDLASTTVTVSFRAKGVSGATLLGVELSYANSADNFAAVTSVQSQNITLTSGWSSYTLQYSLPANAANGVEMNFFGNTGGAIAFRVTGVQLEPGTVATPFERRSYGQELALCQRYFESYTSSTYTIISGTYYPPTLESYATWTFAVTKRATPTFAISSGSWAIAPTTITPGVSNVQFGRPTNYFYLNTSSVITASAEI